MPSARARGRSPFTVTTGTAQHAASLGVYKADFLRAEVGLPAWPLVRLEVVDADIQRAEQAVSNFPDLVGAQEAADLLGVSRQRLYQLRADGRFPEPMIELAATPVWLRAAVEQWVERWDRRPGRPAAG